MSVSQIRICAKIRRNNGESYMCTLSNSVSIQRGRESPRFRMIISRIIFASSLYDIVMLQRCARVFDFIINVSTFKWIPATSLQQTELLTAIDMFMVRLVNERFTNSRELLERAIVTFYPVTHVNLYNKNQIFQPSRPNRNFHETA